MSLKNSQQRSIVNKRDLASQKSAFAPDENCSLLSRSFRSSSNLGLLQSVYEEEEDQARVAADPEDSKNSEQYFQNNYFEASETVEETTKRDEENQKRRDYHVAETLKMLNGISTSNTTSPKRKTEAYWRELVALRPGEKEWKLPVEPPADNNADSAPEDDVVYRLSLLLGDPEEVDVRRGALDNTDRSKVTIHFVRHAEVSHKNPFTTMAMRPC